MTESQISMRVHTSGIVPLYFSVRGVVRAEAGSLLEQATDRAEPECE